MGCGKGVEVWGNENYTQLVCESEQHQGKITILNGGTIENAEIGVLLAARNGENYNQTGGIIQVRDNGDSENVSARILKITNTRLCSGLTRIFTLTIRLLYHAQREQMHPM